MTTQTETPHRYFTASDFDFAALHAVGKASQGVFDIGVVLATLDRIADGDPTSWFQEWTATADDLRARADASAGRVRSALLLGAAQAYAQALDFVDGMPDDDVLLPTFRRHRESWEAFVDASDGAHVRVAVPYEGDSMPGFLLRPDASGRRRPTLVITNGSDGSLSGLWAEGIRAALDRGWNAFVFDGPGQQSMLFERDVPFRHDWETVLTPVVDRLLARADVGELLASGISQGGYWLPRALAFEHRFGAAVVDDGVVDVAHAWFDHLPQVMLDLLAAGDRDTFNLSMNKGPADPAAERELAFRARPYGFQPSAFDLFTAVGKFVLDDETIGRITTPLLVLDADGEEFFEGQPRRLYDALTGPKAIEHLTARQGADHHCSPLARTYVNDLATDFLEAHLTAARA